jgi:DNA-binding MurR/RpiR family transcriptional regulator
VNANPGQVALLSQKDLATAADASKPVVISLFRKLHSSSHKEFRGAVEEFFSTHIDSYRASQLIQGQVETVEELIAEAIQVDIRSLERLSRALSAESLTHFVEILERSERVYIMGPGTAEYPAHYLAQRLRRYKITSVLVGQDVTHHLDELFPITKADMILVFHYSDRDDWLWPVLNFVGERGATRMLVAASIHPRYVALSDEFVHVPRGELRFKNSMAVPMAFANLLLLAVEITRGEEVRERLHTLETARDTWERVRREQE